MNSKSDHGSWNLVMRVLHGSMAVLFLLQLTIGWIAGEMERSPARLDVMTGHKSLGVSLLILTVLRLWWRWRQSVPPAPAGIKPWENRASSLVHALLYFLLFALPLSGWLAASTSIVPWKLWWLIPWPRLAEPDPGLHDLAETAHGVLVWALVALLILHVAAALRHHFIKRNDVLVGMWTGSRKNG